MTTPSAAGAALGGGGATGRGGRVGGPVPASVAAHGELDSALLAARAGNGAAFARLALTPRHLASRPAWLSPR